MRLIGLVSLVAGCLLCPSSYGQFIAAPVPGECVEFDLPTGARVMYCVPARGWNGNLIVYAHGYVAPDEPLDFQNLEFGGVYLPEVLQRLGFAFATTTYRQNGLVIREGLEDMLQLVQLFPFATHRVPRRTIIGGASEGGLIAVLALERYANFFDGGVSLCGPIGNFDRQTDYFYDFRNLFDVYFPGLLPGDAVTVPPELMQQWDTVYEPLLRNVIATSPETMLELTRVAHAAVEPADPATIENTVLTLLWYHAFSTLEGEAKLHGSPYDNRRRHYRGSSDDAALNATISRYQQDAITRLTMAPFETSGRPGRPLVILHTTSDETVPFWHEQLYFRKMRAAGASNVTIFPIRRYGHCEFTVDELLAGFLFLLGQLN